MSICSNLKTSDRNSRGIRPKPLRLGNDCTIAE